MSNNKHQKKIDQSNYLSSLLLGGSAVAAARYSFARFGKQHLSPQKKTTFVSPKLNFSAMDSAPNEFVTELTRTLEGASLAKIAWEKAVSSVDPNATQTLTFAGNIKELEGTAVGSAIVQTINQNQSLYMGKIYSRFKQNVGALSRQYSKTNIIPQFTDIKDISLPEARNVSINQLPGRLRKTAGKITKAMGDDFTDITFHTRGGWEQDGLGLYVLKSSYKGKSFEIPIPLTSNGVLVEGRSQSSKRIAPKIAIFDPKTKQIRTMERDEYFLDSVHRNVISGINQGKYKNSFDIQRAIQDIYSKEIYSLQSVPNVPSDIKHEGLSRYINIRSQAIDIRIPSNDGYRKPSGKEFTEAMKVGKFIPSTSGTNISEGRVSFYNPAEHSMTPTAVDFSRSPGQAVREWKATPEAVAAMMSSGRLKMNKAFDTASRQRDLGLSPYLRTLYIDPSRQKNLMNRIRLDEGESLMANRADLRTMSQVSRLAPGVHLKTVRSDLEDIIAGKGTINPGEIIGWTAEGSPFSYKAGMNLKKFVGHTTGGKGEFGTLLYEEIINMPEHAKKFGDIKAVERLTNDLSVTREVVKQTRNNLFLANIERWASMDDLRKDQSKHNKQMITALWEVMSERKNLTTKGKIFMRNPQVYARMLEGKANTLAGGAYNSVAHKEFIKGLMKFGLKDAGLNAQEFGYVFGAVPSVVGKKDVRNIYAELAMNEFSFRHLREMYKGFAGGMSQTVFNSSTAGGYGSLEPRAFELLQSGQYGALGEEISQDLMSRMMISNPEMVGTHEALTKTLGSLAGTVKSSGKIWDLQNKGYDPEQFQAFIEQGGGFLRSGKGLRDVYVPGALEAPGMGRFKTASQNMVKGKLAQPFHELARDLTNLYSDVDQISIEDAKKKLATFGAAIQAEQAPAGKGMGSLLRGKDILGSRFLTGVSEAGGKHTTNPFTVGISEGYATSMFEDLMDRGVYGTAEVRAMKDRLFSGQTIGGVVGRHPFIGQYSLQPVNFQLLRDVQDSVMTIPSTSVPLKIAGQAEPVPVNISPLAGFAGDKDADTYAAFLVNPDIEKKIRQQFVNQDNEATRAYMQHTVRAQILKAKAKNAALDISNTEKMIADAKKLGTAQEWVGKLSTELSVARRAVSSNMKGQQAADAMFLLEWLEQTPISGKHLDPKRVLSEEMGDLFTQIQSSIQQRNPERLQYAVEDILRNSDENARALLGEGLKIEDGSQAISQLTGVNIGDTLPGINLKDTTGNIMNSLNKIEESGMAKISRQLAGRSSVFSEELSHYLSMSSELVSSGAFSSVAATAMATKNKLASAGLNLLEHKKILGFGFLGALAIGTALSTPSETIGPGGGILSSTQHDTRGKAIGRMSAENIASQPVGNPRPPDMLRARRSMIQGHGSSRMSVRATTSGNINNIVSRIKNNNRDSNISINVRDSSSILNVHSIANKVL